ncbi:MAG: hypothetical protein AAFV29_11195, partial [Myxococcota bacterium]
LTTGEQTNIASNAVGSGPSVAGIRNLAVDRFRNRALAVLGRNQVLAIDLNSGDRTVIADGFETAVDIVIRGNDRALVFDGRAGAVVEIDLLTETTTVLSKSRVGNGPRFGSPRNIALDATNNRALITESSLDAVLQVDLASGDRTILSDDDNEGATLIVPQGIALGGDDNALIVDTSLRAVLFVDLVTGARTIVSNDDTGLGPNFSSPQFVRQTPNQFTLVVDSKLRALIALNPQTGDRSFMSGGGVGSGLDFDSIRGLALDVDNQRALVMDVRDDTVSLVSATFGDGNRTILSNPSQNIGAGPPLDSPFALDLDRNNNRVLVTDSGLDALMAVDIFNGDRSVISGRTKGTGVSLLSPQDVVVDSVHSRALIVDAGLDAIIAIELETGARAVVSGGIPVVEELAVIAR